MNIGDFILATFEGDAVQAKYTLQVLSIDNLNSSVSCYLIGGEQNFTFSYHSEPWMGTDAQGQNYMLSSHDIFVRGGISPLARSIAAITFMDGNTYLASVDDVSDGIKATLHHGSNFRVDIDINNIVIQSDWDTYPIGTHVIGVEGCTNEDDNYAINKIIKIVNESEVLNYNWKDRGIAPKGFLYGLSLVYAKAYSIFKHGFQHGVSASEEDEFIFAMIKPINSDSKNDAIAKYSHLLTEHGANLSIENETILRSVFTLLFGLGMRESSGKYCTGWDRGKLTGWGNPEKVVMPTSINSEAGLFQVSYDIGFSSGTLERLYELYKRRGDDPFLDYFRQQVKCSSSQLENFGEGEGVNYQVFCKTHPSFAVMSTAMMLRQKARHWGPIRKDTLEIITQVWSLLIDIENEINNDDHLIIRFATY